VIQISDLKSTMLLLLTKTISNIFKIKSVFEMSIEIKINKIKDELEKM